MRYAFGGCMKIDEINVSEHYKQLDNVLTPEQKSRGILIGIFQELQKEYNYLPGDKLAELSEKLDISLSDIYSTATFYQHFHFEPRGRNIVSVCTGTACHVRGASKVIQGIEGEFGITKGQTTADMSMTLETVGCVGCCGLAPVVTVNSEVIGDVGEKKIKDIITMVKE